MTCDQIKKVLRANGWEQVTPHSIVWTRPGENPLYVTPAIIGLFDAFFTSGHRVGFEKGAYEEMTQEDAER